MPGHRHDQGGFHVVITDLYGDIPHKEAYRIDENIGPAADRPAVGNLRGLIDMLLEANSFTGPPRTTTTATTPIR